jgi:hypothetical protein
MRHLPVTTLILALLTLISCSENKSYNPDDHLSASEKNAIMTSVARNLAKAPENITGDARYNAEHDEHYQEKISQMRLEQYTVRGDDYYFLISQPAPSMIVKRHATGGRFKLNDSGEITEYEEVFRTWKLIPDTLKHRSYELFDKMVKGESLDRYRTKNSNGVEYIEFPDDLVYYDIVARTWRARQ